MSTCIYGDALHQYSFTYMSKYTWERIPTALEHAVHIYQTTCQRQIPYPDTLVHNFVKKSSDSYRYFHRNKLLGPEESSINAEDFNPMVAKVLAPLIKDPIRLQGIEALSVEEIMAQAGFEMRPLEPLISQKPKSVRNTSNFLANILSSFASTCSPLQALPPNKGAMNSFFWYRKLLASTPIIIFLRQKQRLFAETTILQQNLPYEKLRKDLDSLTHQYRNSSLSNQKIRNYYFTNLATPDLFRLASLSQDINSAKWNDKNFWLNLQKSDPLSDELMDTQKPHIIGYDKTKPELALNDKSIPRSYPLPELQKKILRQEETPELRSLFPYDVHYSDLYILTIEEPILQEDHEKLLDVLEQNQDMEIIAARLMLYFPDITNSLLDASRKSSVRKGIRSQNMNYDELLKMAQETRHEEAQKDNKNFMSNFFERLGRLGLVYVEDGSAKNTINIMKHPHS